ncbi:hypothetical protein LA080_006043 [Diaporthe eres]|nr:hypothetical protein LA080_006043 [Diaporthe eres]
MDQRKISNISSSGERNDGPRPGQSESLEHSHEHSQGAPSLRELQTVEHTHGTATRDSGRDGERFQARENEAKKQIRQRHDTWSLEQINSVASVMVAYQNGLAVEMETEDTVGKKFSLGPKSSETNVYEIVTAYKLVPLPNRELHWRNFFLTPKEVDVSEILQRDRKSLGAIREDAREGQKRANAAKEGTSTTDDTVAEAIHGKTSSTDANLHRADVTATDPKLDDDATAKSISDSSGFSSPHGQPDGSSPKNHIEFLLWRNLERILSVCAMPLRHFDIFEESVFGNLGKQEVVALTCGDMSGHRVCPSASYFAFEFLVSALRRLQRLGDSAYVTSLKHRIEAQSPAKVDSLLETGCFAANYWVNGSIISREGSSSWQPRDAITDTPYQILKLAAWAKFLTGIERQKILLLLRDIWVPWLYTLESVDKRGSFAWPHSREDGINTFRLDDHMVVWRSLAELKSLSTWDYQPLTKSTKTGQISWNGERDRWLNHIHGLSRDSGESSALNKTFQEFSQLTKRLLPENVQNGILHRFTVENEVLEKRMLALTRSPRETRFLLHARDTILFHTQHYETFFLQSPFHDLWNNTLNAQPLHEENTDDHWDNTLRFMLSIVTATRQVRMNHKSRSELLKKSIEVVIGSSAHNGFITGELGPANRHAPSLFSRERDRDYYYHVGFEACYILLLYARTINEVFRPNMTQDDSSEFAASGASKSPSGSLERDIAYLAHQLCLEIARKEFAAEPQSQRPGMSRSVSNRNLLVKQPGFDSRLHRRQNPIIKKVLPFNNGILDASRINTFEEEWLYSYPEFLTLGKCDLSDALKKMKRSLSLAEFRQMLIEFIRDLWKHPKKSLSRRGISNFQSTLGTIMTQHIRSCEESSEYTFASARKDSTQAQTVTFVADIPQQRHLRRRDKPSKGNPTPMNNEDLWKVLEPARTISNAKKRFIWLPHADKETAFLCHVASADSEKNAISLFFDRHASFEKHVFDNTNLLLNIWRTELHLSFYVLGEEQQCEHVGLPPLSKAKFPGRSKKYIRRASIGFRFNGNLFDRYRTCHFIQYIPTPLGDEDFANDDDTPRGDWKFDFNASGLGRDKEKHWWQRKVLELHLLKIIVDAINTGASDILHGVKQELGVDESMFTLSILDGNAHKSSNDLSDCQRFEQILQATDEDVTDILKNLQKWCQREADRGQTQPRWTRNDERRYRGYINEVQAPLDQQIWKLEITRNNLRSLRESLTTSRERIQHSLEISREENIRYFTYVTVIFLPLGFAASFYSMGGPPEHALIISLVQFAAAAFAVTLVLLSLARPVIAMLLFFAKPTFLLGNMLSAAGEFLAAEAAKTMDSARKIRKEKLPSKKTAEIDQEEESNRSHGKQDDVSGAQSHHLPNQAEKNIGTDWFWLVHLFLQVPAQQLSLTIVDLKSTILRSTGCAELVETANSTSPGLLFLLFFSMFLGTRKSNQRDFKDYSRYLNQMTETPSMLTKYGPKRFENWLRKKVEKKTG